MTDETKDGVKKVDRWKVDDALRAYRKLNKAKLMVARRQRELEVTVQYLTPEERAEYDRATAGD